MCAVCIMDYLFASTKNICYTHYVAHVYIYILIHNSLYTVIFMLLLQYIHKVMLSLT